MAINFPNPSASPWTEPNSGDVYIYDPESGSWLLDETTGAVETLESVTGRGDETDKNIGVGPLIYMNPDSTGYNGGPHELEAVSGESTNWGDWTAHPAAEPNLWTSVTYGNGKFVAVAYGGSTNSVMTSVDGEYWKAYAAAENIRWSSVTYAQDSNNPALVDGKFVAVARDGGNRVMTSADGEVWVSQTAAEANQWYSVTYGNGKFVAVSIDGTNRVMTSPDGETWTAHPAPESNPWGCVTYAQDSNNPALVDGKFVAVTTSGINRVMTSPDGETWTAHTAAEATQTSKWRSVTYGNGKFVAVGDSGSTNRVMTSPDGETWTAHAAEASKWQSVTYGGGKFVAVATVGTNRVMTSVDGETWTAHPAGTEDNYWWSVTYGNGKFVAVANSGTNRVITLDVINTPGSLYYDGEKVVSSVEINDLESEIEQNKLDIEGKMPYNLSTLPDPA